MKQKTTVSMAVLGLILAIGLAITLGVNNNPSQNISNSLETKESVGDHVNTLGTNGAEMTITEHENTEISKNLGKGTHEDEIEPDMPGMDHSDPSVIDEEADRPLKATLGTFGVATSIVLSGAIILRRRDRNQRELKVNARKDSGEVR